jgi:hypothetical protein
MFSTGSHMSLNQHVRRSSAGIREYTERSPSVSIVASQIKEPPGGAPERTDQLPPTPCSVLKGPRPASRGPRWSLAESLHKPGRGGESQSPGSRPRRVHAQTTNDGLTVGVVWRVHFERTRPLLSLAVAETISRLEAGRRTKHGLTPGPLPWPLT